MNYRIALLFLIVPILLLEGCAFVNVSLFGQPRPLEEQRIEGSGDRKIVLVDLSGFISDKESGGALRPQPSPVVQVREALQKAADDPDVAGVILRINSPGGTVAASDIIHHEIVGFRTRTRIPVYAVITGIGASGGYYAAAGCDEISAHPAAVTGSIGVLVMKFQITALMDKIGISEQTVKSGAMKDIMSPFRAGTPEENRLVQGIIDELHGRFIDTVLARPGNRLSREQVIAVADGRIYTAQQALNAGIIDRVAYLDETITLMKARAGLDRASIVIYYRPGGYRGTIYSGSPDNVPPVVNLVNLDLGDLELLNSSRFLYLWQ